MESDGSLIPSNEIEQRNFVGIPLPPIVRDFLHFEKFESSLVERYVILQWEHP